MLGIVFGTAASIFSVVIIIITTPAFCFVVSPRSSSMVQASSRNSNSLILQSSSSSSPIPPPPSVSLPVWSLAASTSYLLAASDATFDSTADTSNTSMNIVTYAIPVSVSAPKLWIVSLYKGSLTKDSFLAAGGGVLQLLTPSQKHLVFLGQQSGYDATKSKKDGCSLRGYTWTRNHPFGDIYLLPKCVSYIQLQVKECMDAGDHVAVLCQVVETGNWDEINESILVASQETVPAPLDQSLVLYSALLREEGLI